MTTEIIDRRTDNVFRRHPMTAFFALAFGLSWLAWTPYILSRDGIGLLPFQLPVLMGSPQTLGIAPGAYLGPITAAILVTAFADGRQGLRKWAARLVRWRVDWRWYAGAVLGVPAVLLVSTMVLPGAAANMAFPTTAALLVYVPMLIMQVLTTGLAEEPGWRDFAQPRLQDRFGVLKGTFILSPLWGVWHLPLFLTEWAGWPHVDITLPIEFVVACFPLSIVMTWFLNRTNGSVPVVMLLHANVNNFSSVLWEQIFPTLDPFRGTLHALLIGSTVTAIVLLVATRGRLGYRPGGDGIR